MEMLKRREETGLGGWEGEERRRQRRKLCDVLHFKLWQVVGNATRYIQSSSVELSLVRVCLSVSVCVLQSSAPFSVRFLCMYVFFFCGCVCARACVCVG